MLVVKLKIKDVKGVVKLYSWRFEDEEREEAEKLVSILESRGEDVALYNRKTIGTGIY